MRDINYIVLHCTAGPQSQTPEEIQKYWKSSLGWKTPGYHYMIKPDGEAVNLVPTEKPSNGVKNHNHDSINISYIGGVVTASDDPVNAKGTPIDNRTPAQRETMKRLVTELNEKFPDAIICGHRDFSPDKNRNGIIEPDEWMKSCPSFSVKDWLVEIGFKTAYQSHDLQTTTTVNIRSGPGVEFAPVSAALKKGTKVKKVAGEGEWSYVTFGNLKGWVSSKYLTI
jgi:N-acetylmuramoyl-L-alanine amidase